MKLGETPFNASAHQKGFSLVEMMVGVAIGLIAVIVMFQVFAISEERKHTTTASGDAQNNATIALDQIQRDISRSGYGFTQVRLLGCSLQLPSGATITLAPAVINSPAIPSGDANTDTLLISFGTSDDQTDGYKIDNQSGSTYTITGTSMLKKDDRVVVSPDLCGANVLALGTVQSAVASIIKLSNSVTGSALFNLGANPVFVAYAIRSGNLTVCNFMTHDCGNAAKIGDPDFWRPIAENVVSLRAEYGHDTNTPMDGIVDTFNQTTPDTSCKWAKASAIQLVLTARSTKLEPNEVTENAPSWKKITDGSGTIASSNIDLSADPNWKHYRYKVFQTVAPIRNVAWMGVETGC